jgi:hypothetical protein
MFPARLLAVLIPWINREKYGSSKTLCTRLGMTRPMTPLRPETSVLAATFGV